MNILVTGGAGYIGGFMVKHLASRGDSVVVLDNTAHAESRIADLGATLREADIRKKEDLVDIFRTNTFDAVIHFAGYIAVGESEREPEKYYENNVVGSTNLFEAAIETGAIKKFIFSSSAAVYGNPHTVPIPEDHEKNPTSNYGKNKLDVERILASLREKHPDIGFTCLRYFNASGAALDGSLGEHHTPETHIIPLAIRAALTNAEFHLYGTDYDTSDGTCVRDYIHVLDLVTAHARALDQLEHEKTGHYYNVGTGMGYSNREVLDMVKRVSGIDFRIVEEARREGDPAQLIADPSLIKKELGFSPEYSDLYTIVESAWKWHTNSFSPSHEDSN